MNKIKILRIIARLNIGGPAIHTILLTEGLDKDEFETLLICGSVGKDEADMSYYAQENNIEPIFVSELKRELNFFNDIIAFKKIFKIIRTKQPDIIHTHTAKAGALGRLAGIIYNLSNCKKQIKLIHTFHGHVFNGYFNGFRTRLFILIEQFLSKFTDKIIVVSEKIKNDLLNLRIGNPEKIAVIPLGLELDRFLSITESPPINSVLKVGIIGRLAPIKNHWMFLEAAKIIRNNGKIKVNFFIIGDGELRENLENYARQLGIDDAVTFMGWQKDLEKIYQDLDIVALTSLNEGTPLSLIEAMAAGRAVIATDVGGVKDLIGNSERGILVKSGDVNGFAQGIRQLLENPDLRNKISERARDFVKDKFTKERLINDIELLYNKLFERNLTLCAH